SIRTVRDSVRRLLRDSREQDRKTEDLDNSCYRDMQQFVVLIAGRVIGGQKRDLTEKDRRCLQQVLGFEIPAIGFEEIAKELRTTEAELLDRKVPMLLKLQVTQ